MGKAKSAVVSDMEHCFVCGNPNIEIHHIFFGTANRKISDEYGYVVPLCPIHHRGDKGAHFDSGLDGTLKKMAQTHFEYIHGSREFFIKTFGKSYL